MSAATTQPIRLALIGAGIFVRDAHAPALNALGDMYRVVAVCSRSQESAQRAAALFPYPVETCTDIPALLARDDVEAVDILLPIAHMPAVTEMALRAGKHVISEKPIAPDVETGRRLLAARGDKVWLVAENWRYDVAFIRAAELIEAGEIGTPILCDWALHLNAGPGNKYYATPWRRDNSYPGGFLLDGGVHHVAALRLVMGEIASVSTVITSTRSDMPPADTLCAALQFANGAIGSFSVTYAVGAPWDWGMRVVGTEGAIRVQRTGLEIVAKGETRQFPGAAESVDAELADFASAIRHGTSYRGTPEQALQDVAVIEAMLQSAATGQRIAPVRVV